MQNCASIVRRILLKHVFDERLVGIQLAVSQRLLSSCGPLFEIISYGSVADSQHLGNLHLCVALCLQYSGIQHTLLLVHGVLSVTVSVCIPPLLYRRLSPCFIAQQRQAMDKKPENSPRLKPENYHRL